MKPKNKKKYTQSCSMGPAADATERSSGKKISPLHNRGVNRKSLASIYDKYYRDQVAELYRAVID